MSINKALRIASKIAVHAIVVVVLLELCARTDDFIKWGAPFWGNYAETNLWITDSLGYHNKPNTSFEKWRINSFGFRSKDITFEKPLGVVRVVLMGASETFGLYESPNMEFPAQMQQIFDRKFPGGFQVLNAACPGMSPSRITHYYRVWIHKFDPDYVVYYPTPSFMLDADTVTILRTASEQLRPHFHPSFRIGQRVSNAIKQFLPATIQTYVREWMVKRELQRHPSDWVVDTIPESAVQTFEQNLVELANTVRQSGATMIFATHASRISDPVTKEELPALIAWRKQNPRRTEHCIVELEKTANTIIRQVSVEQGIPVVDLVRIVPKSSDYFADYLHFTDKGAEVVADAFVKQVFQLTR